MANLRVQRGKDAHNEPREFLDRDLVDHGHGLLEAALNCEHAPRVERPGNNGPHRSHPSPIFEDLQSMHIIAS